MGVENLAARFPRWADEAGDGLLRPFTLLLERNPPTICPLDPRPTHQGRAEGQEIPHTHGEAWQAATPPSTVSDLFLCRRLWRLVVLFRPWQTLFLAGLSIAEALVVAQGEPRNA